MASIGTLHLSAPGHGESEEGQKHQVNRGSSTIHETTKSSSIQSYLKTTARSWLMLVCVGQWKGGKHHRKRVNNRQQEDSRRQNLNTIARQANAIHRVREGTCHFKGYHQGLHGAQALGCVGTGVELRKSEAEGRRTISSSDLRSRRKQDEKRIT